MHLHLTFHCTTFLLNSSIYNFPSITKPHSFMFDPHNVIHDVIINPTGDIWSEGRLLGFTEGGMDYLDKIIMCKDNKTSIIVELRYEVLRNTKGGI